MRRLARVVAIVVVLACARLTWAHPVPFSYVDIRLGHGTVDLTLVAHIVDVAHDLDLPAADVLLDPRVVKQQARAMAALLQPRLALSVDGRDLGRGDWPTPEVLPERQSLRWHVQYAVGADAGSVGIRASLFPYQPEHQTFVNVYEGDTLAFQAILDQGHPAIEYFTGIGGGALAVVRRFIPSGIHHILIGPDHLLFLLGLLLPGGSVRRLLLIVTAFTLAHSLTLSLAALNLVTPPARLIEPAIALSIVYVGADNLLSRGGRDVRAWIALGFGLIHGFGFANVLREMHLPARALGWSLFSFNVGVEIGQLLVVVVIASALAALRSRNETTSRRLVRAGSIGVVAAGTFWFVQRVFFS
jgi:hydrogenase/urease accessory protein HupE